MVTTRVTGWSARVPALALTLAGLTVTAPAGLAAAADAPIVAGHLRIERQPLGLLDGPGSEAKAVRDGVAVGSADRAGYTTHAVAYDLRADRPRLIDLGTLGGRYGEAVAVADGIVVGTAELPNGARHAFAYDLGAPLPRMVDLGAPGGVGSRAVAVGDGVVAVVVEQADNNRRAFAYDLRAALPRMIDLGTLGGAGATAVGVDRGVVVGQASTPGDLRGHAFAYDVRAAQPRMVDLGTLGGAESEPFAVDDGLVVGDSDTADRREAAFVGDLRHPERGLRKLAGLSRARDVHGRLVAGFGTRSHAVVYDGRRRPPRLRDLGALGGTSTWAVAVSATLVAGSWFLPSGRGAERGFVCDLVAPGAEAVDLGYASVVNGVDGDIVVGRMPSARSAEGEATAWIVRRA